MTPGAGIWGNMPQNPPNEPKPSKPTQVEEPDPVRPPNEPVPKHPQKPEEYRAGGAEESEEERPETQGE